MEKPGQISELQLKEYSDSNTIAHASIVKWPTGYVLAIRLTWREGTYLLYAQRRHPRTWASLDRLIAYLANVAPTIKTFDLIFDEGPPQAKQ